jgi:hypothetical protein
MNAAAIVAARSVTTVWLALGGDAPRRGRARAFYRDGNNPQAVSLNEAKGCWYDHRDGVGGGVLDLIQHVRGCDRGAALRWLADLNGMPIDDRSFTVAEQRQCGRQRVKADRLAQDVAADRDDGKRTRAALSIWQSTKSAWGTPVEAYLSSRGLTIPPPPSLRFAWLKHPSGNIWPTMVALIRRGADGVPVAIHRTFLAHDGTDKASVERAKLMLGPVRGGAVRLAPASDVLMVGEGIETCLAAMQESGHPAWAALSTSGLRTLDLPPGIVDIIVLADGDDPGEAAALEAGQRWAREGRRVRIARPPRGLDFNDLLLGRAPRIKGDAA